MSAAWLRKDLPFCSRLDERNTEDKKRTRGFIATLEKQTWVCGLVQCEPLVAASFMA